MFKWLRGGNASKRVGLIESLSVGGKRRVILVRRDNIEHLVLVGGRTDVVIEPTITRRPVPKPAHRPAPVTRGLPPPGAPTRESFAEAPPKSRRLDLGELTRGLEAELRGSQPFRRPLRAEVEPSGQFEATNVWVEPDSKQRFLSAGEPPRTDDPERDPAPEMVPNDSAEKNRGG
jgi:flagellar protein FliO/FliZ